MPLIAKKKLGPVAELLLWKITEDEEQLRADIFLHPSDQRKFSGIKNPRKKMEFLALRQCLRCYFGEPPEVFYRESGKPYLQNGYQLSMSHAYPYAGIILSRQCQVGIDLETERENFRRIAPRYMSEVENRSLQEDTALAQMIHYWGAKEVMVKITGNRRLHFRSQLRIAPFLYRSRQTTTGLIVQELGVRPVKLWFERHDELYLSYGWLY